MRIQKSQVKTFFQSSLFNFQLSDLNFSSRLIMIKYNANSIRSKSSITNYNRRKVIIPNESSSFILQKQNFRKPSMSTLQIKCQQNGYLEFKKK